MDKDQKRIAIAKLEGWTGCDDDKCEYHKCQHLHRGPIVGFPEPYSTPMYPDYLNDLNAMHKVITNIKIIPLDLRDRFIQRLGEITQHSRMETIGWTLATATAEQLVDATLFVLGKYES